MSLYAQHGYGKAEKLNDLAAGRHIGGVILSPADETFASLRRTVREMGERGLPTLLDPQTYVYTIPDAVARCHYEHGIDFGPLAWGSLTPQDIQDHARAVVAANDALGTSGPIVAPTPLQPSFAGEWAPIALQYARATLDESDRSTLASLVIDETALASWETAEQWLDIATTVDVTGFYIVVARHGEYPAAWDATALANLLRLVYRLAHLNGYQIVVGYADITGTLAIAAGAMAVASGWSYRQRLFRADRWVPRKGGRHANPRVTSARLLAPLHAVGDAMSAVKTSIAAEVLSDPFLRNRISTAPDSWSQEEAHLQHLEVLGDLVNAVEAAGDIPSRLVYMRQRVAEAQALGRDLRREGVSLDTVHLTGLSSFASALAQVQQLEGI